MTTSVAGAFKNRQRAIFKAREEGTVPHLEVRIRLTPKSSPDAIDGLVEAADGADRAIAIKARVRAVPQDGAANSALIASLAKWLGVPKSSISLAAGGKSRTKLLTIRAAGGDIERMTRMIDALTPS